ncbi:MAG: NADPH-dependent 2,4-dienoyl-CoA reductase/sulfur reductase-like enzyme [Rhodothermales bacterium]|jgi:NADPH-dependent 2,4-dienoyl-CoA reductase/sulfur reductase-like enzyme
MASQRIFVIGGVAAGPAAAAQAKRVDPEAEVVLLEQGSTISYGACEMPYLLTGLVAKPDDLVLLTPEQIQRTRGVDARILHRVEHVDAGRRRLRVHDLATLEVREERYDKLILATGAHVRLPDVEGLEGDRVHTFRTLADAATVDAQSRGGRERWVVLGGGFIGLEVAEQLALAGHRVTVLAPGGPMGSRLAPTLQRTVEDALRAMGVGIRQTRATGVRHGAPGAPIAVRTDDGELVGAERVLAATGTAPNVELAIEAGLRIGTTGAIATDENMRTSNSSIWACGDCAEVHHLVTDAPALVPLSPNAFRTARVAGTNAARTGRGAPARFRGTVGAYALKVAGLEIAIAGLSEEEARTAGFDPVSADASHSSRAARMPGRSPIGIHLLADRNSRRLLGGQLVGQDGAALRANVLVPLLRQRATVEDLYDLDLIYTPPVAPSLDPLLVAARSLQKELDR